MPGIAFAEWGPGDMGMSLGFPDAHDPPIRPRCKPPARASSPPVKANGLAFLEMVNADNVVDQLASRRDGRRRA